MEQEGSKDFIDENNINDHLNKKVDQTNVFSFVKKTDLNTKVINKRTAVATNKHPNEPDTMDLIQQKWDKPLPKTNSRQDHFKIPEDEEQPNKSMHSEDMDNMFKTQINKDDAEKTLGG